MANPKVPGALARIGTGAPSNTLGEDTDLYLRLDTGLWYKKTGGAWGLVYQPDLPTSKLVGQVTDAQIASVSASKITGTIGAGQVGPIPFTQITGVIAASQLPPRLGEIPAAAPGNDLDQATQSGWYYFSNTTAHAPPTGFGFVQVYAWPGVLTTQQVAYAHGGNAMWIRYHIGTAWIQIYPPSDAILPARLWSISSFTADCNAVRASGWNYAQSGATANTPYGAGIGSAPWGVLETVMMESQANGIQRFYTYESDDVFQRRLWDNAWQSWQKVWPLSGVSVPAASLTGTMPDASLPARIAPGTQVGGITVSDWNNAKQSGWYDGLNASNAPGSGWFQGEVITHRGTGGAQDYITQRLWTFTDGSLDAQQRRWQRQCINSVWTSWVVVSPADTYGTAFPASPQDGDYHTLVDSTTNPVYAWRFRYVASISDAYKWVFVGGAPYYYADTSGVGRQNTVISTWQACPGLPAFTLPRAGKYQYIVGATQYSYGNIDDYIAACVAGAIYSPYAHVNFPVTGGWAASKATASDRVMGTTAAAGASFTVQIQTGNISSQSVQFPEYLILPERLA